jgi:sec-independent protein translocase protein TatB
MLDVAPTELLLVGIVALLVIGPKDLPRAMRFVGKWVGKARGVARQFRSGFDAMVRESELAEMEKQWAAENERIMRENPPAPSLPAPDYDPDAPYPQTHEATAETYAPVEEPVSYLQPDNEDAPPVMTPQPAITDKPKRVRKPKPVAADGEVAPVEKPKRVRKPKTPASDEPQP